MRAVSLDSRALSSYLRNTTLDTYFDGENPPGDLEAGEFRMLGDELNVDLMVVKMSRPSDEGAVCWRLCLVAGPSVKRALAERSWPSLRIQKDGSLVMRMGNEYRPILFRVEDTVPLGVNLYDRDPADPGEVFDRANAAAEDYREQ